MQYYLYIHHSPGSGSWRFFLTLLILLKNTFPVLSGQTDTPGALLGVQSSGGWALLGLGLSSDLARLGAGPCVPGAHSSLWKLQ